MTNDPLHITIEPTADPDVVKITFNRQLPGLGRHFTSATAATDSPLGAGILSVAGVCDVFLLGNYATVRKQPEASWQTLGPAIQAKIFQLLK